MYLDVSGSEFVATYRGLETFSVEIGIWQTARL